MKVLAVARAAAAAAAVGVAVSLSMTPSSAVTAQARPLPVPETFLDEVRENLARSDREQYRYAYRERRSELHTNPFGKLGTDGLLLYAVKPGEELGLYFKQLIERDGQPVVDGKQERIDRRDRPEENRSVNDVVSTLTFELADRQVRNGRDHIVVHFGPKKDAKPRTRQGKMAKVFKGTVWIDEAAREVSRVEATAIDNLSYGWGIVARLNEGTRITMVREPVEADMWLPTSIRLIGEGRAILFRKLKLDFTLEWFDYERILH